MVAEKATDERSVAAYDYVRAAEYGIMLYVLQPAWHTVPIPALTLICDELPKHLKQKENKRQENVCTVLNGLFCQHSSAFSTSAHPGSSKHNQK